MTIAEQLTAKRQASLLHRARRDALGRMTDLVRIERPTDRVWNRETGDYESGDVTVIYGGKARLKPLGPGTENDSGERPVSIGTYDLLLPYDVSGVSVSDVVVFPRTGRRFNVAAVDESSNRTALHVSIVSHDPGTVTNG